MVAKSNRLAAPVWPPLAAMFAIAAVALWRFPLFHLRPLVAPAEAGAGGTGVVAAADIFWNEQLPSARATDVAVVLAALRKDPKAAIQTYAHRVGLGAAYFFVSGEGRVVARERSAVRLAVGTGADAPMVELQTGPVFGNTVRDGTGLLDVNRFSSLQDFNALAAELNERIESRVLPTLRGRAQPGTRVSFTGCAEAVEPAPGQPLLAIVPTRVEIR
jgi:predicted lipoprotein